MTDFRREALQDFVENTEGDRPPVYVGREDIIAQVEAYARTSWKGPGASRHGVGKATTVVQGAPGAGKSALIHEMKDRSILVGDHLPEQYRVVTLTSEELMDDLTQVLELVGLAGGLPIKSWETLSADMAVGFDLEAVKAKAGLSWTAPDQPHSTSLLALKKRFPSHKWQGPVVVCVDETQNLKRDRYAPHARFLKMIHNGESGLPLSLVPVGLSDTADVLDRLGLTRPNVHEMGALRILPDPAGGTPSEVMHLMLSFCDHFGIDRSEQAERLMALADPCEGWPRHLHYALQAMGREVLRTDGELTTVNWRGIMQEAAKSRMGYYRLQQAGDLEKAPVLAANVMMRIEDGMHYHQVEDLIRRHVHDRPGERLPKGMDTEDFLQRLVHRGTLHKREDGTYHCPIPSFRNFLIRSGGLEPGSQPPPAYGKKDGNGGTGLRY